MFVSEAWLDSSYSKQPKGEMIKMIVYGNLFVQRATKIVNVTLNLQFKIQIEYNFFKL